MNLNEKELNIILGALNNYVTINDLPEEIKESASLLREQIKKVVKHNIKEPYMNNYCEKCKNHYLLDFDESRCRAISLGMSNAMCIQVTECSRFVGKREK